ncbi:MAG TPA: hypothetical protein VMT28_14595 [Terriglobales bacterium]|jgi:hypothetical protein|nr:hypothetical protein [Terriglobales bacterium]
MATAVRVPTATWVGIEIATVSGKKVAYPMLDPVPVSRSAQQEVIWYCTDPTADITIEFPKGSPFIKTGPYRVMGEDSVSSGHVKPGADVCLECPARPKPGEKHVKGHYKYRIVDTKTQEVLADPEVIIRN